MRYNIGEGDPGNSWLIVQTTSADISTNVHSYWCKDKLTDIDVIVMKDTPEGEQITEHLRVGEDEELNEYIFKLVKREMTSEDLRKIIASVIANSVERGRQEKMNEIRACLGLNQKEWYE